jgi:hypothetical protein
VRFYDTYPGEQTGVPGWIKARADYTETVGQSEGLTTSFPDWRSPVLQQFVLEFFTAFAERYDDDPRLAYLQVGFGLWGEYHIYDGPNVIGQQFPSKTFQESFMRHLDVELDALHWSISIDAGDDSYGPFQSTPQLLQLAFGLFDDSFMIQEHAGYNASMWDEFAHDTRMHTSPAGGELSYASDFDQAHALDVAGMYGRTFETLAREYALTYMIGNDQPDFQTDARIKAAGMAIGHRFRITALRTSGQRAEVEVENTGIAPIAYDAFVDVDGVRSATSLRGLQPGQRGTFQVAAGSAQPTVTIACDRLVAGQVIGFDADL